GLIRASGFIQPGEDGNTSMIRLRLEYERGRALQCAGNVPLARCVGATVIAKKVSSADSGLSISRGLACNWPPILANLSEKAMSTQAASPATIVGPPTEFSDRVLTPDALEFVAALQREFGGTRE